MALWSSLREPSGMGVGGEGRKSRTSTYLVAEPLPGACGVGGDLVRLDDPSATRTYQRIVLGAGLTPHPLSLLP